jgi:hypothetical protein
MHRKLLVALAILSALGAMLVAVAGPEAAAIYAVDRLSNVRDLRRLLARDGSVAEDALDAPLEVRLRAWGEDREMVERQLPEFEAVAELRVELEELERDRADAPCAR